MTWVIDASAAVEVLLRTEIGDGVFRALGDHAILAPELLDAEVLSALRRIHLAGRLDESRATEALDDLQVWDIQRLPHVGLLDAAWAHRHQVSAYDALYIAVAEIYDASVLTADGPLSRAPSLGVAVHNVRA